MKFGNKIATAAAVASLFISSGMVHAQENNPFNRGTQQLDNSAAGLETISKSAEFGSAHAGSPGALAFGVIALLVIIGIFIVAPIMLLLKLKRDTTKNPALKNRMAWFCGVAPIILGVLNLIAYPFLGFFGSMLDIGGGSAAIFSIIRVFQSLFGLVFMILIPVGIIFAIVIATRSEAKK